MSASGLGHASSAVHFSASNLIYCCTCLQVAIQYCFRIISVNNDLLVFQNLTYWKRFTAPQSRLTALNDLNSQNNLRSDHDLHHRIYWLGPAAYRGDWSMDVDESILRIIRSHMKRNMDRFVEVI